jgi:UDP-glucuronate decarboxylase
MRRLDRKDIVFVVTGATGWLGRVSLDYLESRFGSDFNRRVVAFASKAGAVTLTSGKVVSYRALASIGDLPQGRYVFLHCAFLGKERVQDLSLTDFVRLNEMISRKVCETARRVEVDGLFVPSSGAVYSDGGNLDVDLERNPYGVMKRRDEERFGNLAEELGVPLVMPRVFNIAGSYINKLNSYALSSIIMDILARRPVALRAAHPVVRSYVHAGDLIALALACLEEGRKETLLFDTAGEVEIEVGDLARLALEVMGATGAIVRPPMQEDAIPHRYVGDGTTMLRLAARYDIHFRPLPKQVRETADFMRYESLRL